MFIRPKCKPENRLKTELYFLYSFFFILFITTQKYNRVIIEYYIQI